MMSKRDRLELGEQRLERGQESVRRIRQFNEAFERRFRINNPRLVERYAEGEGKLLIHFHVEGFPEEFVALLERQQFVGGSNDNGHVENRPRRDGLHMPGHHVANIDTDVIRACCDEQAVLVDLVQRVQLPEPVALPSLVRLGCIDCIYGSLARALYVSVTHGWVLRGAFGDREVDAIIRLRAAKNLQPIGDLVGDTPKVSENIGGDRLDVHWNLGDLSEVIDALSGLRVFLDEDRIWLWVIGGFQGKLKVLDVLFGPCDFRSDTIDGFRHGSSPAPKEALPGAGTL